MDDMSCPKWTLVASERTSSLDNDFEYVVHRKMKNKSSDYRYDTNVVFMSNFRERQYRTMQKIHFKF